MTECPSNQSTSIAMDASVAAPAKRPRHSIEEEIDSLASELAAQEFVAARDDVEEYFKAILRRACALVVEKPNYIVEVQKIVEIEKNVVAEKVVEG